MKKTQLLVFLVSVICNELSEVAAFLSTSSWHPPSPLLTASQQQHLHISRRQHQSPPLIELSLSTTNSDKNDETSEGGELNQEELLKYLDSDLSISYQEYQIQQKKLKYLVGCPVFKNLSSGDISRLAESMRLVDVKEGSTIIQQGLKGDEMYFLVTGSLECIDENTEEEGEKLLTTYDKEGEYFGEISLLFGEQRKASIRALEDCQLYKLDKRAFQKSMLDTEVFDTARDMILKKYTSSRLRDVLLKLTSGEIADLLRAKLQPQQKLVSVESRLRLFAWGAATTLLFGALSSSLSGIVGGDLYDLTNPLPKGSTILVSSLLTALSFVSTSSDTNVATSTFSKKFSVEWLSVGFWLVGLSNLTGTTTTAILDAWGIIPKFVLILSLVGSMRNSLLTVTSMVNEGRQDDNTNSNPLSASESYKGTLSSKDITTSSKGKKTSVLLAAFTLGLANVGLLVLLSPIFSSFDHFRLHTLPTLAASPGLVPYLCIVSQFLLSFVSLDASRRWMFLAAPLIAFDAIKFGVQTLVSGNLILVPPSYVSYLRSLGRQWRVLPVIVAAWLVVDMVQSIRTKTSSSSSSSSSSQRS